ncbi:MAG: hypothetical protein KGO23_18890, partial [Nitrospirota bacterium]|nr:hypothetical protein [Nitrospirota bacterium]
MRQGLAIHHFAARGGPARSSPSGFIYEQKNKNILNFWAQDGVGTMVTRLASASRATGWAFSVSRSLAQSASRRS